jgi:cation diffusion facilitator CzcD-associated flavoprotein CzcO
MELSAPEQRRTARSAGRGGRSLAAGAARLSGTLLARGRWLDHRRRGTARDQNDRQNAQGSEPYDVIVVGAGLCGVVFLKHARQAGLRSVALDKQEDVGGLWHRLPAWQDIQNRRQDFAIDGVPLDGVRQPDVVEHVHRWVREHGLREHIRLRSTVTSVSWSGDRWSVEADDERYETRYLVIASGTQNEPIVPKIERAAPEVVEMHSSELRRPEQLRDRRVTVVGGGASAWDLLDLAVEHGASDIHWVYRNPRWFLPTTRAKHAVWPNLRQMALIQSITRSPEVVSAFLQGLLRREYRRFGLRALEPARPFEIQQQMLIPGRATMVRDLDGITRHRSEVRRVEGCDLQLADGTRHETDVLLWGTGYRMDLAYLGLPEYSGIRRHRELTPRLGSLVRSRDHPNLFFVGMSLSDTTSSTPFFAAIEAKSIVAHILGTCEVPTEPVPHQATHWHVFRHFASFDRANYRPGWWQLKYFLLAWWYALLPRRRVRV